MSTEILDQSPLYHLLVDEAAARDRTEGRAEGEAASTATLLEVLAHVATDTLEQMHARLGP